MQLHVGTCGWSYPDWVGPFYPRGTDAGSMLKRYARVFDTVEVNATFYAIPPVDRVERWARATPDDFTFSVKAPKALTHDARLELAGEGGEALDRFLDSLVPLGTKLDTVLVQLPPSLTRPEGLPRLERLLDEAPVPAFVAVEARHESWAHEETYALLRERDVTWVWSENVQWASEPVLTSSRAYLRLIGDREIDTFDRLQRDPEPLMSRWYQRLEARGDELRESRVYVDNHFAGFGPGTANAFIRLAGEEPRRWKGGTQAQLGEFGPQG